MEKETEGTTTEVVAEVQGTSPKEGGVAGGGQEATVEAPQTISPEEHQRVVAEVTRLKDLQANNDRVYTRLANERDAAIAAQAEAIDKKISILARRDTFTEGDLNKELAQIDTDVSQRRSQAQHQSQTENSLNEVRGILAEAGIDLDAQSPTPDVIELRNSFMSTSQSGGSFDGIIARASKIALAAVKSATPDPEKLKQEGADQAKEQLKKSAVMKSDHSGTAAGQSLEGMTPFELLREGSKTDYD